MGESVVLHVEQRTSGNWKQVPRSELEPGQCWVYRRPVEVEPEVAHSVQWEVVPEGLSTSSTPAGGESVLSCGAALTASGG